MASAESRQPRRGRSETGAPDPPIRIGISSCLLGDPVRFDGGHKRDPFLTEVLGPFVEFVPVCPEVEVGMGVPRESVRLVREGHEVRLVAERSGTDHTRAMRRFAERRVAQLRQLDLSGYVLKKDSPSCGMERVRVYGETGPPERKGRGMFAAALLDAWPLLPVEEEGRLKDPRLRENFIERVFAYRRLQACFRGRWSPRALMAFHAAHELQILAHSPKAYRDLRRLVADGGKLPRAALRERYAEGFLAALRRPATPRRQVDVLRHCAGHLREHLDRDSRAELHALIEGYRNELVPLVVLITLIRHHVRRFGVFSLRGQHYLEPHPKELMLRYQA